MRSPAIQEPEYSRRVATQFRRATDKAGTKFLNAPFHDCPVKVAVGVLGKKWSLRILGHIAVFGHDRFNLLLAALPGIRPKVLSAQLKELQHAGLLVRVSATHGSKRVTWRITERGRDTLPILLLMAGFASKYYPDRLFEDERPRNLDEILDSEGLGLIRSLA
jgi:DNA-binding HxlR family transcriptional regulator